MKRLFFVLIAVFICSISFGQRYYNKTESDAKYFQLADTIPFSSIAYTKAQVDALFPTPYATKIVEQKARVASQNLTYTGTVRMVGVGQTYTTLTDAYAAAANGDILQLIDGTYNLASESGGYWLVNTNTKGVLVRGNVANNGAVIISQTTATAYGIRLRDCNSMTFENITFTSNQNATLIQSEAYTSNNYNKFKNCIFTLSNTGVSPKAYSRTSTIAGTNTIHIEFDNCIINTSGSTPSIAYGESGVNEQILIKSCTFNCKNFALLYYSNNHGKIAVYDSNFTIDFSGASAIQFGENTAAPTFTDFTVDVRNNNFSYINNTFDHAILAGRGTNKIYCVNNTFHAPAIDDGNNMAIVIKTIASAVGNAYFAGNYMSSARPIYLKGAKNCIIKYNTFVSNVPTWECLSVINPASDLLSTGNVITQNNFIGGNKAIMCYPASGFDSAATSLKTGTIDYNNYYSSTTTWAVDNITSYTFANRYTFWTSYNDTYSMMSDSPVIILDIKPVIDNTTVN